MSCVSVSVTSTARFLSAVALLALVGCATQPLPIEPSPEQPVAAEPTEPVAPDVPPEPAKRDLRLTIAAVGDMMIGTNFPENHLPDDDGVGFLAAVTPALHAADITFGNLEGVLVDGGEPAKKCKNPKACYLFRSPTRYAELYRKAGFDLLSLANNHARDFGEEGRTATMQALDAVGIHHSGREGEFASLAVNDLTVAFLAYAVTKDSNMLLDYELTQKTVTEYAATHIVTISAA